MTELKGKVALITGASGGIGTAIARRLAQDGIDLILCGRSEEKLKKTQEAAEEYGVRTHICVSDLTENGAPARCIEEALQVFGLMSQVTLLSSS